MAERSRVVLRRRASIAALAVAGFVLASGRPSLAASPPSSAPAEPPFDLLIVNGRVLDGAGNPWRQADIGIRDGKIARLGRLEHSRARQRIDASGRFVAPGFIDLLGQSEYSLLVDPRCWSKVAQGITTEITGEGGSPAPQNDLTRKELEHALAGLGVRVDWSDLEGYYARLERGRLGINFGTFAGAEQVRRVVLGESSQPPTPQELDQMVDLVVSSMRQGAFGVSSSLIYPPGAFAGVYELVALAEAAGRLGGIYISHIRSEAEGIDDALTEAITIGREAKVPVEIWHLKISGRPNWGKMPHAIERIEAARAAGLDIKANVYPYTASSTTLSACVPLWAQEGGSAAYLARLRDPATRRKIRDEIAAPAPAAGGSANRWRDSGGSGEGVLLSSVASDKNRPHLGKKIADIARARGADPLDTLLDLILEEENRATGIYFSMSEEDLREALRQPWVSIVTDSPGVSREGVLGADRPHPRAYGSFPRVLGKYVRAEKLFSWEEAVRRMTSLPASRIGLTDRGVLSEGYWADIVIFDPLTVADRATFEDPAQEPAGIDQVIINGELVVQGGRHTGKLPGRILRSRSWSPPSR